MVVWSRGFKQGSLLLELILGSAMVLTIWVASLPAVQGFVRAGKVVKLNAATKLLAMDIVEVQRKSIYQNVGNKYFLSIANDGKSYKIFCNTKVIKKIQFHSRWGEGVQISSLSKRISFSSNGTPEQYSNLKLTLAKTPKLVQYIEVQPVTGRVVITNGTT